MPVLIVIVVSGMPRCDRDHRLARRWHGKTKSELRAGRPAACPAIPRAVRDRRASRIWCWNTPPASRSGTCGTIRRSLTAGAIRLARAADRIKRQGLHAAGAVLEGLRPEQVRVSPLGQVLLDPTVMLLPLPAPREAPIRPSLVSAPEVIDGRPADPRSDLYCIGAVLYALELGHELSDLDFRGPGDPIPFLDRFPEAHPLLGRLLGRTLARFREQRFPSPKASDLTGFEELCAALAEERNGMLAASSIGRGRMDVDRK